MEDPDVRIVRFGGGDLSLEEAQSGRYVFAAGPPTQTIYAFDKEPESEERTRDELRGWASEHGLEKKLVDGWAELEELPADPEVDPEAEIAEVARIRRDLDALARETGLEPGPELIRIAVRREIFGSAILFRNPLYRLPPYLPLSTSCPDLGVHYWDRTQSCVTIGYNSVHLYEDPRYGPNKRIPAVTLVGTDVIDLIPGGKIGSVLFV